MGRGTKARKQPSLLQHCLPMLPKPGAACGKYADVLGKYWDKCPAADKARIFKCIIVEFKAIHDFGGGVKGAGMLMKEMGESGEGSLEPGIASGEEFIMPYPNPFLQYYWAANKDELSPDVRRKLYPSEETTIEADEEEVPATEASTQARSKVKEEGAAKHPCREYLDSVSSTLNTAGRARGTYTNKCICNIQVDGHKCGSSVTLYCSGDGKAETTSNWWTHMRDMAEKKGCEAHKAVLSKFNASNPKLVQGKSGEYMKVMSFEEAFPHHVDFVWCRAAGHFTAHLGEKPLFRRYVRGECTLLTPPQSSEERCCSQLTHGSPSLTS